MNSKAMGTAVAKALQKIDKGQMTQQQMEDVKNTWDAICGAIIDHITANAIVKIPSVSGVKTGTGTSGPGVGTIS